MVVKARQKEGHGCMHTNSCDTARQQRYLRPVKRHLDATVKMEARGRPAHSSCVNSVLSIDSGVHNGVYSEQQVSNKELVSAVHQTASC
jgi:hypothetical protein